MKLLSTLALLTFSVTTFAQVTYTSTGSATDWTNPASWTTPGTDGDGDGYPDSNDDVVVAPGHSITVSSDEACLSLKIHDDGSVSDLTVSTGNTLTVGGNVNLDIDAETGDVTLDVQGSLVASGDFAALADVVNSQIVLTVGSSGTLDINGTGSSSFQVRATENASSEINNDGSISCAGDFEIKVTGSSTLAPDNVGTFQTDGNFMLTVHDSGSDMDFLNKGTLDVDGDLEFKTGSGASATACVLDMKYTDSQVNLAGAVVQNGSSGTVSADGTTADFDYDGSSAQTVSADANVTYHSLSVSGSKTATLGGSIAAGSILGDVNVGSGTTLAMSSNTLGVTGNVGNNGTITLDATMTVTGNYNNNSGGTTNASALLDVAGNFTNAGTYTSTASGTDINVAGNWANTGTYTASADDIVTMDGTTGTATMTGSSTFENLTIDHSGTGVTNSGYISMLAVLDIDDGTFTTGDSITLQSNASGTASLMDITGGDISGTLKVKRYISVSNDEWREITSPVQGTYISDWMGYGLITTGFTNSDFPTFGFVSVQTYNENDANGVKDDGFKDAVNANTDVTVPSKGNRFYIGQGSYTLRVTGAPYKNNQTYTIDYEDDSVDPDQKGWNLVGNPYPCTIDWDNLSSPDRKKMENKVWTWSGENANFGVYVGGTGGPGTHGVSQYIASSQGFWVHATDFGSKLILNEDDKVTNDPAFVKSVKQDSRLHIRVTNDVNHYADEVILDLNDQASLGYDAELDAKKMFTLPEYEDVAPAMAFLMNGSEFISYNSIPVKGNHALPLYVKAGEAAHGEYQLHFDEIELFLPDACILLEDLANGDMIDVRATPTYTYSSRADFGGARFVLHIIQTLGHGQACATTAASQTKMSNTQPGEVVKVINSADEIRVQFDLHETNHVVIDLLDLTGKEVMPSVYREISEGTVALGNVIVSNGIYLVRVSYGGKVITKKVFLN